MIETTTVTKNSRLEQIKAKLNENPSLILKHFNIDYIDRGTFLKCECPCHKGADNKTGFTLWTGGSWNCHTRCCHEQYGADLIGLVFGILSNRSDAEIYFPQVLDYCEQNIGISQAEVFDCELTKICNIINKKLETKIIDKKSVVQELEIPSPYFLGRGYSEEILNKFCIGDCHNPQKPMFNRAVCPIFDEENKYLVGAAGRRIPNKEHLQKWKYSYGFKSGSHLYGLWIAREKILKTSRVIVVEGMMDVAKLHEMGYNETVGLFGVNITNNQIELLNKLGVMYLDIMLDGDECGKKASLRNYEKCKDYFNVRIINTPKNKDPDELSQEEIDRLFKY